jgi:hypothetical protein
MALWVLRIQTPITSLSFTGNSMSRSFLSSKRKMLLIYTAKRSSPLDSQPQSKLNLGQLMWIEERPLSIKPLSRWLTSERLGSRKAVLPYSHQYLPSNQLKSGYLRLPLRPLTISLAFNQKPSACRS